MEHGNATDKMRACCIAIFYFVFKIHPFREAFSRQAQVACEPACLHALSIDFYRVSYESNPPVSCMF